MMTTLIAKAAVLGLSTGMYCLGYCLPVLFPLIFAEKQTLVKKRLRLILEFGGGRLVAYLVFGGVAGYLGQNFSQPFIHKLIAAAIVFLSVLLILYGLLRGFPQLKICFSLQKFFPAKTFPAILGLLTGLNICPPFLLAVSYVFERGEVYGGIIFFFIFFLATSLYLLPFIFAGYFSKFEQVRWVAQLSAILGGGMFLFMGVGQLLLS